MPTLKKFLHYYKPHKAMLIFDLICATVVSLVDISFPQILNVLNKSLFTMDATVILHTIGFVAIGLIVMYLIKLFCDYFIATWGHIMGSRMESAMRSDLFDKMQRLPFSYYDKNNTGEMMAKMVSDLFDISEVAHHGPENLFLAFLKLIGSFVLLMMVHVPLTLILFAVVVIMCIFSIFQNKRMKKAFSDNNKKIANINAQLQDSLAGIRVVKSFANETVEKEKFQKANVSFLSSKKHSYHAYGRFQSGNLYFQGILFTVILVFGGIFIAQGTLNAPDLALYALYINIFINPITILSTWYAFPDNPMLSVWRIVLGLGVALLVALSFRFWPPATSILKARTPQNLSYEEIVLETTKTKHIDKKRLLVHMEREFSQLLFYFSMAATVLSIVQVYGKPWLLNAGLTLPEFTAIPILLMLAFFFSICSTSDAIIGKSLSTLFPISSVMGFLILGPMLDIKNVYILKQYMPTSFIIRLSITIAVMSYIAALVFKFFLS